MSVGEIAFRAGRTLRTPLRRLRPPVVPPPAHVAAPPWLPDSGGVACLDADAYERTAGNILSGLIELVPGCLFDVGVPTDWRRFPPLVRHAQPQDALEVCCFSSGAHDVRLLLELHRHAHLVQLVQTWRLTGADRYREHALRSLDGWIEAHRQQTGPAWDSALEPAVRLLHWSLMWQWLHGPRAAPAADPRARRWLDAIYRHARFVAENRSRFSSANNHLVGELAALYVAALTWPFWSELCKWGKRAREHLETEMRRQVGPDGVHREQAFGYQVFVFELFASAKLASASDSGRFSEGFNQRLRAMARYMSVARNCAGLVPAVGDDDHGTVWPLAPRRDCDRVSIALAVAAHLTDDPALARNAGPDQGYAAWLLPGTEDGGRPRTIASDDHGRRLRRFDAAGVYVLGSKLGEAGEVLALFDAGPLGYLSIAAHGHADALSLLLSVHGEWLLVDRGTYVYNVLPAWRDWFRSTAAHNTACVDGASQSVAGGPFLWLRHARSRLLSFHSDDAGGHVEAEHDGYLRLRDPVMHRRRVEWSAASDSITIVDSLACRAAHVSAIAWHFAPEVRLTRAGQTLAAQGRRCRLDVDVSVRGGGTGAWSLHRGGSDEPLGWHSDRFGCRRPAFSALWTVRHTGPVTVITVLGIRRNQPVSDVAA